MNIIIFSYNRAMQLSALIDSILKYYQGDDFSIKVLYNSSNEEFEEGYKYLSKKLYNNKNIFFYKETKRNNTDWSVSEFTDFFNLKLLVLCPFLRKKKTNFRSLLLKLLKDSYDDFTMFLTDDAMFIRPFILNEAEKHWILNNSQHNQFSFRHGLEVSTNANPIEKEGDLEWKFTEYNTNNNWGYNFSLDAHVYSTKEIYRFLKRITFSNPNTLESSGILHVRNKVLFCNGRSKKNICILSFPINIVQDVFDNESLKADPQQLNTYFLNGYELQLPEIKAISTFQQYPEEITLQKGDSCIKLAIK